MTADEYRTALAALGITQAAAGRLLGVSQRTAHSYAVDGPPGPASLAIALLMELKPGDRARWIAASDEDARLTARANRRL